MSEEQRANNLGIDPDLRNRDPAAYQEALQRKLKELTRGLAPDPPLHSAGSTSVDRASGNKHNEPLLDSFSIELTLLGAKRYAGLLPANRVPLSWLRGLATAECPELATRPRSWDLIVRILVSNEVLLKGDDPGTGVRAAGHVAREAVWSMDDEQLRATRNRLRAFCSQRLEANRAEERRVINAVMTGDPETEATAWTVPRVDEVQRRAAGDERVEIVEFGDGTYSVRPKPSAAWEMECLKAFAAQEFAGRDLEGVAWALRTKLLTSAELEVQEERIGKGHLREPENDEAAIAASLYWLNRAYKHYGEGWSSRGAWDFCKKAVEILQRLQERKPDDLAVAELLAEAKKSEWAFDD
jgi:hypothetical protein